MFDRAPIEINESFATGFTGTRISPYVGMCMASPHRQRVREVECHIRARELGFKPAKALILPSDPCRRDSMQTLYGLACEHQIAELGSRQVRGWD